MKQKRVPTGIPGLDPLLEGGLPPGKSYLVTGCSGTGKSIFCAQFLLKGLMDGEKAVYVAVDEKPRDILEHAASLNWELGKFIDSKQLLILDASSYFTARAGPAREKELDVQKTVSDLASYVKKMDASRVVIDPVSPLLMVGESTGRVQDSVRILVHSLQDNLSSTNLLTSYSVAHNGGPAESAAEEYLVEGVLVLAIARTQNRTVRTLSIRKMRGTAVDLVEYPFTIKKGKGIVLSPSL
jgi:circadian clock protein KaiC